VSETAPPGDGSLPLSTAETWALHVKGLRHAYVRASFRQRYQVAMQRLDNPGSLPNELVATLSVLEAIARAIVTDVEESRGQDRDKAYRKIKNLGPVELLARACHCFGLTGEWFGADWELVPHITRFRNLLVHEATFLDGATCKEVIATSGRLRARLCELYSTRVPVSGGESVSESVHKAVGHHRVVDADDLDHARRIATAIERLDSHDWRAEIAYFPDRGRYGVVSPNAGAEYMARVVAETRHEGPERAAS
jgi:hypothetical protein